MVSTSKAKNSAAEAAASAQRVIKKYPNRRLYDTQSSAYITLTEVKKLVVDAKPFVVLDAKTSEDLTRSILLQIILEEEMGGVPMFSEAALANIIRFYGNTLQGVMGNLFEKNMQTFMEMQAKFSPTASPGVALPNLPSMNDYISQSLESSKQMQEQMLAAWGFKR